MSAQRSARISDERSAVAAQVSTHRRHCRATRCETWLPGHSYSRFNTVARNPLYKRLELSARLTPPNTGGSSSRLRGLRLFETLGALPASCPTHEFSTMAALIYSILYR
jgi:hypothetical protein